MKLIYLVTEDWYFHSHRLPMVRAAQRAGFDVCVITNVSTFREKIESHGIRVIDYSLERRDLNPLLAIKHIKGLADIYRHEKPDLVHHIGMKPILYGGLAARLAGIKYALSAFAGLGMVFHSNSVVAVILRPVLILGFRVVLRRDGCWTLFQNEDDYKTLKKYGIAIPERTKIIRGSGVDVESYPVAPMPESPPFICVFAGRMIDLKGLPTLQTAFALLKVRAPHIKLWLCGKPDHGNPGSWNEARLKSWCRENPNVIWKGHQDDMRTVWPHAHLAVQPSWGGEGLPKSLLEAAACARAIVASNVAGCREVVDHGHNGFLVPAKDAPALADAILTIASNMQDCISMGKESRKIAESDLSANSVSQKTEMLYREIISG